MTNRLHLRREANSSAEPYGIKLTYLPFIIKGLAECFRNFPEINSVVDDSDGSYVVRGEINIGLATDTPDGLTVVVATHSHDAAEGGARVLRLDDGSLVSGRAS